jgi:integrase
VVGGFREQGHASVDQVLADAKAQGLVGRNVAELVNRVSKPHKAFDTYTEEEVQNLLAAIADDRLSHAWELALSGLRRGEIAGLRWSDIDLDGKTLSVVINRVDAGGTPVENDPKSQSSRRTLPLPDRLVSICEPRRPGKRANDWRSVPRLARGSTSSRMKSGCHTTLRCSPDTGRRPSRRQVFDTSSSMRLGTPVQR